ncbi:rubredoxin [Pollutimonas harenae]|uniref:Rubredoxin n=1 Tax=Pollutimonas harenae TaxID=657015 RepID=A0A853GSJ3_9BURK|nr:rubredoxin [Pollutimonas harenae]NYT85161.1 rubredoxin [Pollutimonas harenae]TEA73616.1 rubredoxin [Pollutimonas harenae]
MAGGQPSEGEPYAAWICILCGWVYDESAGDPANGVAPGTRWADVPDDWTCPDCGVGKDEFEMVEI